MTRHFWSDADRALLCARYPHEPTLGIALALNRPLKTVYAMANHLGLCKTSEYLSTPFAGRLRPGANMGGAHRFKPGHTTWNKGKHFVAGGRSAETQFKPGHYSKRWDPERYAVGALRWNGEYVDIKFRDSSRAWRPFHLWLWEQENGPLPRGHAVVFRDRDVLNIELANLELVTRADLMRRNTIHNLPEPLKNTIQLLGQLNRRIREKQDRRSAQPPDAGHLPPS